MYYVLCVLSIKFFISIYLSFIFIPRIVLYCSNIYIRIKYISLLLIYVIEYIFKPARKSPKNWRYYTLIFKYIIFIDICDWIANISSKLQGNPLQKIDGIGKKMQSYIFSQKINCLFVSYRNKTVGDKRFYLS